ncbi:hypothetical protein [Pseudonocardia sp. GCM10023141]|uniref:hypothetical protein n=1 Tax=Pseudonocardia sp. GCM10023141 TaxID=3252653 RepID=UPI00360ECE00
MAPSGPFGGWDPFRPLESMASLWTQAAAPLMIGPVTVVRTVFETVQRHLVGRAFTVRSTGGSDIALTLAALNATLDPMSLSVGQLGEVRLAATDITVADHPLDAAVVTLHNLHVQPAEIPLLVAAPVEVEITVAAGVVLALVADQVPRLLLGIGTGRDGVATVRWRRHPRLGHVEIDVHPDGSHLWLRPRALVLRGRRRVLGSHTPAIPVALPALPRGLRLTAVTPTAGAVVLRGTLDAWQEPVPVGRLEELLKQLRSASTFFDLSARRS